MAISNNAIRGPPLKTNGSFLLPINNDLGHALVPDSCLLRQRFRLRQSRPAALFDADLPVGVFDHVLSVPHAFPAGRQREQRERLPPQLQSPALEHDVEQGCHDAHVQEDDTLVHVLRVADQLLGQREDLLEAAVVSVVDHLRLAEERLERHRHRLVVNVQEAHGRRRRLECSCWAVPDGLIPTAQLLEKRTTRRLGQRRQARVVAFGIGIADDAPAAPPDEPEYAA